MGKDIRRPLFQRIDQYGSTDGRSRGGLASTQVDVRCILREALLKRATSMILCHNHPSGNIRPSQDDDRLTHALLEAARTMNIRLLDHVVVSDGDYYSYGDEGRL